MADETYEEKKARLQQERAERAPTVTGGPPEPSKRKSPLTNEEKIQHGQDVYVDELWERDKRVNRYHNMEVRQEEYERQKGILERNLRQGIARTLGMPYHKKED